jgi:acylglycerol lipase
MFHGLNAWSGHSAHVAKALTDIGCLVVAFDHRGFGKSEGIKGLLDLPTHLADSQQFVDRVEDIYGKNIPKFLAGLSMGGMTSYRLSLEKPERYAGTILIAPAIQGLYNSTVKSLAKFMSKIAP